MFCFVSNPAHLTWYWVTPFARRSATMSSGSYTSSPAARSKALCGVRFFPLPCAFSAGAGGAFGLFFPLPLSTRPLNHMLAQGLLSMVILER